MFEVNLTLAFELLTPKSKRIIYGSWPFMIQSRVNVVEICLKLISGQDFANAGQTEGWTDRRTEG